MRTIEDYLKLNKDKKIWHMSKEQTVRQALILMSQKNIGAIIILENDTKLVGIFSERDYARKVILEGKSSQNTTLDEVMSKNLICISKKHTIEQCMEKMTDKRIRHLPILENNEVIGIISIGDVLKIMINEQKDLINHYQRFISS
mgnify:CR=1 FL=1|jgi:CBS domain-containing protein|tara:strand:+ start:395 stop:829 length:435 start_codon:yes stop_codon:yes gene_type:complete